MKILTELMTLLVIVFGKLKEYGKDFVKSPDQHIVDEQNDAFYTKLIHY